MLAVDRQKKIIRLVKKLKSISVQKLSEELNASLNTIRSDIGIIIQTHHNIIKTHGGIILTSPPLMVDIRHKQSHVEKQKIGKLVFKHLEKYDSPYLFIDSSTTSYACIKELSKSQKRATIITYSVDIFIELNVNQNISAIGCGGIWWGVEHCFIGTQVSEEISKYKTNISILGASGLMQDIGILNGNIETSLVKQIMSQNSEETWIVCENYKFDNSSLVHYLDFSSVTKIFTNSKLSKNWEDFFQAHNIEYFTYDTDYY
ncbi:MAG: DeoR/GlpR family DNA-binding transcription regulator [Brevinema sp.]